MTELTHEQKLAMWKKMVEDKQMEQWEYDLLVKGEEDLKEMIKNRKDAQ